MQLKISHLTKYHYDEPVHYSLQQVRLTPKSRAGQRVEQWDTTIEGGVREVEFGHHNTSPVLMVSVKEGQSDLAIRSEGAFTTPKHG